MRRNLSLSLLLAALAAVYAAPATAAGFGGIVQQEDENPPTNPLDDPYAPPAGDPDPFAPAPGVDPSPLNPAGD